MSLEDFAKRKPWPEPSLMLTDSEIESTLVAAGKAYTTEKGNMVRYFAREIERAVAQRIVTRLEAACGATSLPPVVIKHLFLERAK